MADSRKLSRRAALALGAGFSVSALNAFPLRRSALEQPMGLPERVSRLFMVSFAGATAPSAQFSELIARYPVGGVILYGRNCIDAAQVRSLLAEVRRQSRFPLFVGVDQEGGSVVRLTSGVPVFPSEAWYGKHATAQQVYNDAAATATHLKPLGITVNLAPVADVISNAHSPIGARSYGSNTAVVAHFTWAAVRGYQQHGLASVAKHFVGLGHSSTDSHQALPVVNKSLAQLLARDIIPFKTAITVPVKGILVAHVSLPQIDPTGTPASLSQPVIQGVIRNRLHFQGAVMTDSLVMGALPVGSTDEAAESALLAGADVLLVGSNGDFPIGAVEAAVERIVAGVKAGRIPESRLAQALNRGALLRPGT